MTTVRAPSRTPSSRLGTNPASSISSISAGDTSSMCEQPRLESGDHARVAVEAAGPQSRAGGLPRQRQSDVAESDDHQIHSGGSLRSVYGIA